MSDNASDRFAVVTASARSLSALMYSMQAERLPNMSGEQISQCRACAAIRHMNQADASHHLENLSRQMRHVSSASRPEVDLPWICPRIGYEFRNSLGRK